MRNLIRQNLLFVFISLVASSFIFISLNLELAWVKYPTPQGILILGGSPDREEVAAILAQENPSLAVWISSATQQATETFRHYNIETNRLHFDDRATDTVSNFTTTVFSLKKADIRHVFLVTSNYHMPRAKVVATIVFGFHGIVFTPIETKKYDSTRQEPNWVTIRDAARAWIWLFTGWSGAEVS